MSFYDPTSDPPVLSPEMLAGIIEHLQALFEHEDTKEAAE